MAQPVAAKPIISSSKPRFDSVGIGFAGLSQTRLPVSVFGSALSAMTVTLLLSTSGREQSPGSPASVGELTRTVNDAPWAMSPKLQFSSRAPTLPAIVQDPAAGCCEIVQFRL